MRVFQEEGGSSQLTAVKRNIEKWPLDLVTLVRAVWQYDAGRSRLEWVKEGEEGEEMK